MKITHQCHSTVGWQPIKVASHSHEHVSYLVHCNPWGNVDEYICECPAYVYRGHCKHQKEAQAKLCGWHSLIGPEEQAPEQRRIGQCPRCGGPTLRQVMDES